MCICCSPDARSSLFHDRTEQFLLLLHGHAANYQGRGSFISNEQQSLYQDPNNPSWRQSLGDIQASFCTPSQTLVASMTAMQLLSYDRQNATIWIARAAPRRWYEPDANDEISDLSSDPEGINSGATSVTTAALNASSTLFGVINGPTRWGTVNFSVGPQVNNVAEVRIAVDFKMPAGAAQHPPKLQVRIRDPSGTKALASAVVEPPAHCVVASVQRDQELVTIKPVDQVTQQVACTIKATFT